jgi:hypothetical protein
MADLAKPHLLIAKHAPVLYRSNTVSITSEAQHSPKALYTAALDENTNPELL